MNFLKTQNARPAISAIMTARNSAPTIKLAVRSTLLALGRQDELLVFLDRCSDESLQVLQGVRDSRLRIFSSPNVLGRSAGRNFLIKQSQGEAIAVIDSDDFSLPWRFLVSRLLLKKYDVVFGTAILFGDLSPLKVLPTLPLRLTPEIAPSILTYRNPFFHSSAVFWKNRLPKHPIYEEVLVEDYLLWVKLALSGGRLFRTGLPLIGYRLHSKQVSSTPNIARDSEECLILNERREALTRGLDAGQSNSNTTWTQARDDIRSRLQSAYLTVWLEERLISSIKSATLRLKNRFR